MSKNRNRVGYGNGINRNLYGLHNALKNINRLARERVKATIELNIKYEEDLKDGAYQIIQITPPKPDE